MLTTTQPTQLLDTLPPLGRTMAGVALLSGLRRGELFALRWQDVCDRERMVRVREAVHEGRFDSPKTAAGVRQLPLSDKVVLYRQDDGSWLAEIPALAWRA